jgi:hypothetical protein
LHPAGLEVVDVCLEMGGPDIARPYVEAAGTTHPSLIDQSHELDARFGITNIPTVMWIDETGRIVRPPERATPPPVGEAAEGIVKLIGDDGQRERYVARLRDWLHKGAGSEYALTADEVLAQAETSSPEISRAAAHFELAQHLWRQEGMSEIALRHFNAAHELQPDNITYKRQAYSVIGVERSQADGNDTEWGRFRQAPAEGEDWPFVSDFNRDLIEHDPDLAKRLGLT